MGNLISSYFSYQGTPYLLGALFLVWLFYRRRGWVSKRRVLTAPKQTLYHRLLLALGSSYVILPQVAFSRFLKGQGWLGRQVERRAADFLACDKEFNVVAVVAIEDDIDDSKSLDRDISVLAAAGIPVVRWKANALPTEAEIRDAIESAANTMFRKNVQVKSI